MNIVNIKEPYYTAGKRYGWSGNSAGLGIALHLLEGEGLLSVTVEDKPTVYQIEKWIARKLIHQYQAYHQARGTTLGVIPWKSFTAVKPKEETPKSVQQKLL